MNELNTQQIVLLCLLVSFVSSIATGITTVSLLDQAPDPVSQTINRVVEKTIERVVEKPINESTGSVERIVETVVVNQEDLTIEAVQKNSNSLVRLYSGSKVEDRVFIGLGVVIDNTGRIVTSSSIGGLTNVVAIFQQGEFEMKPLTTTSPFSVYDISNPVESTFIPATLSDSDNLQLAQSVILLSGRQGNIVSTGIINDLDVSLVGDVETVSNIDAGIDVNKVLIGSIILNLKGEIVGVKIGSGTVNDTTFLPVNNLKNFLSTLSVE